MLKESSIRIDFKLLGKPKWNRHMNYKILDIWLQCRNFVLWLHQFLILVFPDNKLLSNNFMDFNSYYNPIRRSLFLVHH